MKFKNKILAFIVITALFATFASNTYAINSSVVSYADLKVTGTLNAIGESTITLSQNLENEKFDAISLNIENKIVGAKLSISGNILTVNPTDYLDGDATYTIKIITKSGKRYSFKTISNSISDAVKTNYPDCYLLEVSQKPQKGFNYPYFLLIPNGITNNTDKKYMMVEPNNSQSMSDSLEYNEDEAKEIVYAHGILHSGAGGYIVANNLKTPLLVPIFPRLSTKWSPQTEIQSLTRASLLSNDPGIQRVDLQIIAMIKDAQQYLNTIKIKVEDKVLMIGFSASSKFTQRFTVLHPDIIKTLCAGGLAGTFTLPLKSYKGTTLNYPLGVNDIKTIIGANFDSESYKKISQFLYMGEVDDNDGVSMGNITPPEEQQTVYNLFGQRMMPDRWNNTQQAIRGTEFEKAIQIKTYSGVGHMVTQDITNDMTAFFIAHMG